MKYGQIITRFKESFRSRSRIYSPPILTERTVTTSATNKMTDEERLQYRMKHLIPQLSQTRLLKSIITTPSGVPQSIEFPMTWGKIAGFI